MAAKVLTVADWLQYYNSAIWHRGGKTMKFEKKIIKIKMIENYRHENKLSIVQFCKLCKISTATYYQILNNKNFNITAIFKIA